MGSEELQLIDLDKIIQNSKSRILKRMPRFIVNYFKKLIRQEDINARIIVHKDDCGLDFILKNMEFLEVTTENIGLEKLSSSGKYIFVCNHPLGGIDFFSALIAVSEKFPNLKVIANEILMNVKNLQGLFLPVNAFGRSPQQYYDRINEALASDLQIMTFPAGEVSRKRKGIIKDGPWHRSFVRNALNFKRDVVPVYIHAKNSKRFYCIGRIRKMMHIKLNLELLLLPSELFSQKGKTIHVVFGKPIPHQHFNNPKSTLEWAQEVKEVVYSLKNELPAEVRKKY